MKPFGKTLYIKTAQELFLKASSFLPRLYENKVLQIRGIKELEKEDLVSF
ncbi:hypothetical protein MJH12_00165 [bacterium]|nr:hypothetical protein [bacterium]